MKWYRYRVKKYDTPSEKILLIVSLVGCTIVYDGYFEHSIGFNLQVERDFGFQVHLDSFVYWIRRSFISSISLADDQPFEDF